MKAIIQPIPDVSPRVGGKSIPREYPTIREMEQLSTQKFKQLSQKAKETTEINTIINEWQARFIILIGPKCKNSTDLAEVLDAVVQRSRHSTAPSRLAIDGMLQYKMEILQSYPKDERVKVLAGMARRIRSGKV